MTSMPSTSELAESVKDSFTKTPKTIYLLVSGERKILISSVASHNINDEGAFLTFNMSPSPLNAPFRDHLTLYSLFALSGHASMLLNEDVSNVERLLSSDQFFTHMYMLTTDEVTRRQGKNIVVARIEAVIKSSYDNNTSCVYRDHKFFSF